MENEVQLEELEFNITVSVATEFVPYLHDAIYKTAIKQVLGGLVENLSKYQTITIILMRPMFVRGSDPLDVKAQIGVVVKVNGIAEEIELIKDEINCTPKPKEAVIV